MAKHAQILVFRDDDEGHPRYYAEIINVDADPKTGEDVVRGRTNFHAGPDGAIEAGWSIAGARGIEIDSVVRRDRGEH